MSHISSTCSIIIVTHNSEKVLHKAMECLKVQTAPAQRILLVDSGSSSPDYLNQYKAWGNVQVILAGKDIGFCKGNNVGVAEVLGKTDYLLFLNPDAFLHPSFLEKAALFMDKRENKRVGVITSPLLGYDINADKPTDLYDSTGVFQNWYGRWYDRHQREYVSAHTYYEAHAVPAICGALMFCRMSALEEVLLPGMQVFDERFYMYKEDIELSLRLEKKEWELQLVPSLIAYHCRGWHQSRAKVPRKFRKMSAFNEMRLHWRYRPQFWPYSFAKYLAVLLIDY